MNKVFLLFVAVLVIFLLHLLHNTIEQTYKEKLSIYLYMDIEIDFFILWLSFFIILVFRCPMSFIIIHLKALQPFKKNQQNEQYFQKQFTL